MNGPTIAGARRYTDDDGSPEPAVREALDAYAAGTVGQRHVLTVLGSARLLIPVVAASADESTARGDGDETRHSDVALPLLVREDGRRGVPAFTSVASAQRWRADVRPVPVGTPEACQAALDEEATALVIDVAGPVTHTVQEPFLTRLAEDGTVPEPKHDPHVLARIYRITHTDLGIDRVRVMGSDRADLGVRLELERHDQETLRRVAERLAADLNDVLPGGVELSAVVRARED